MSMEPALREKLIRVARDAVASRVLGNPMPVIEPAASSEMPCGGIFVTLRHRGRLRGCIGTFQPPESLEQAVVAAAVAAARDPRFLLDPIRPDELDGLDLEISLLSSLIRTDNPLSLRPGVDGVLIRRGGASGCFLPQVATEQGWDAEQFLSQCCAGKAGLSPDAWMDPSTEVYFFTAEVIEDPRQPPQRRAPGTETPTGSQKRRAAAPPSEAPPRTSDGRRTRPARGSGAV